jgi:hypothetical protein
VKLYYHHIEAELGSATYLDENPMSISEAVGRDVEAATAND